MLVTEPGLVKRMQEMLLLRYSKYHELSSLILLRGDIQYQASGLKHSYEMILSWFVLSLLIEIKLFILLSVLGRLRLDMGPWWIRWGFRAYNPRRECLETRSRGL